MGCVNAFAFVHSIINRYIMLVMYDKGHDSTLRCCSTTQTQWRKVINS